MPTNKKYFLVLEKKNSKRKIVYFSILNLPEEHEEKLVISISRNCSFVLSVRDDILNNIETVVKKIYWNHNLAEYEKARQKKVLMTKQQILPHWFRRILEIAKFPLLFVNVIIFLNRINGIGIAPIARNPVLIFSKIDPPSESFLNYQKGYEKVIDDFNNWKEKSKAEIIDLHPLNRIVKTSTFLARMTSSIKFSSATSTPTGLSVLSWSWPEVLLALGALVGVAALALYKFPVFNFIKNFKYNSDYLKISRDWYKNGQLIQSKTLRSLGVEFDLTQSITRSIDFEYILLERQILGSDLTINEFLYNLQKEILKPEHGIYHTIDNFQAINHDVKFYMRFNNLGKPNAMGYYDYTRFIFNPLLKNESCVCIVRTLCRDIEVNTTMLQTNPSYAFFRYKIKHYKVDFNGLISPLGDAVDLNFYFNKADLVNGSTKFLKVWTEERFFNSANIDILTEFGGYVKNNFKHSNYFKNKKGKSPSSPRFDYSNIFTESFINSIYEVEIRNSGRWDGSSPSIVSPDNIGKKPIVNIQDIYKTTRSLYEWD